MTKMDETKAGIPGANLFNTKYELVIMRDEDDEQTHKETVPDPFDEDFNYDNWWNQFRGPWLQSEKMTDEVIKNRADDAWECGDYKEVINLMAEMICRLQKQ